MRKPLTWFPFRNHEGVPWRSTLSSLEMSADLRGADGSRGNDGIAVFANKVVLIDASAHRSVQDYVMLHELMHVAVVQEDFGPEEERVITKMAPPLYKILRQFGLRWPERPEGAAALERQARRSSK